MIAAAESAKDVWRDYVTGVGRSFKDGLDYGLYFQTGAPSDIAADGLKFKRRSGFGKLFYLAAVALAEIGNAATFWCFERKSFNEAVYGKSDLIYSSAGVNADAGVRKSRLLDFIGKHEDMYGIGSDGASEGGNVRRNKRIEDRVGGSEAKAARKRVGATIKRHEAEYGRVSIEDNGYEAGDGDDKDEGNRYSYEEAEKEADVMRDRRTALNLNDAWDEAEKEEVRRNGQLGGVNRALSYISQNGLDAELYIEDAGVSSFDIPIIKAGKNLERMPEEVGKVSGEQIHRLYAALSFSKGY